jgi:glyoxylase-like metal-dependent hydrolase (beta-lactamase superfamily II)
MSILFKMLEIFLQVKPFSVDEIIDNGDTIAGLTVLHLPGHTPGSIALYNPKRKVLFIGDTLGCKNGIVHGPPKSVTWDMGQVYQSIKALQTLEYTVLLGGHGEPLTSDASAKVRQFIAKVHKN